MLRTRRGVEEGGADTPRPLPPTLRGMLESCCLFAAPHAPPPAPPRATLRSAMLSVSRTYLEIPVIIHELSTAAVPPAQLWELELINQRARLYRTRVPPDQLNPDG